MFNRIKETWNDIKYQVSDLFEIENEGQYIFISNMLILVC